ncbi:MAG: hypothetical protein JO210_15520 [Acidobacteriaceae bacterium]|nr:hypothetical protein [Acidobacteriaceae bacterium]
MAWSTSATEWLCRGYRIGYILAVKGEHHVKYGFSTYCTRSVQADPKHYTVEFENEKVRVLRTKYGPHEKSPMHGHPALVAVCLTPHYSRHQFSDGTVKEMRGNTGDIW